MSNLNKNTGKFMSDLPPWAKGLVVVAVVSGLGFAIYKAIEYSKKSKDLKGAKEEISSTEQAIKDLTIKGKKPTLDSYKLNAIANKLFTAMNGYGTDVPSIYRGFLEVKNDLDMVNLVKTYGVKKLSTGSLNPTPDIEGTLGQHLSEELSGTELRALNALLAKNGITYRF